MGLATLGHDVFFVEMPSLRRCKIPFFYRKNSDGITVITLPPFPFSQYLMDTWVGGLWCKIARFMLRLACGKFNQINTIVSTPWWWRVIKNTSSKIFAYDYIDHVSVHSAPKHLEQMQNWENKLLEHSDCIFCVSENIQKTLSSQNMQKVSSIKNGVPASWLEGNPNKQESHTGTICGFVGALYEWIDQELIAEVASLLPDMKFIFIGPTRKEVSLASLRGISNIAIENPIPFTDVPNAIDRFDVCLLPFKRDIVSNWADPLKMYEYLARGKPIVSSIAFNEQAPLHVASTATEFADKIKLAVFSDNEQRKTRVQFASNYTWQKQALKLQKAFEDFQC